MTDRPEPPLPPRSANVVLRFLSALERSITPDADLSSFDRRRVTLLARVLLSLLFLLAATLVLVLAVDLTCFPRCETYLGLILGLMVFLGVALALNRWGHYHVAAGLTVACAVAGPWISLLIDPNVLKGDLIPLAYVALTLLLSSMLLPTAATVALAVVQWFALLALAVFGPNGPEINWPSLLALVFFAGLLSLLSSIVTRHDMHQIDEQTEQLAENAAMLREQSIRDHLTGLFNRRYLEETLDREIGRAARDGSTLGVIVLDVDRFKRINDTAGHSAGDEVLHELGGLLGDSVRTADVACRYGGDEFVLVLPSVSLSVAKERAEELRAKTRALSVEFEKKALGRVTVSLGVAVFPDHGANGRDVLRAADGALYRAKLGGRDQVAVATADEEDADLPGTGGPSER